MVKPKIALYARVSTDKDEQKSSLEHQKNFLENLYKDEYEVIVYADEGLTGTNFTKRPAFMKMLEDAGLKKAYTSKTRFYFEADENKEPLFNKIITKSVTRFARNTDVGRIWTELNKKGVSVFFQDINKDTSNGEDEMILNLLLTLGKEESRNISERTKWGNKASAKANKIRNNELYGYEFDRETNSLIAIKEEAEVVRLIFDLCIQGNGYRTIENLLKEKKIVNRKGTHFSTATLKNLLHNKKYCGYNMRNTWTSVGLFTDNHTYKRTKREEWIVEKNDRIEPIISEKIFNKAHEEIDKRLLHGNKGKNISKKDTKGKFVCGKCGNSYYECHSKKIGSGINSYPYYICSTKKSRGKSACDADNIQVKLIDHFIEEQRLHYYDNIKLSCKFKLKQLERKLDKLGNRTNDEINKSITENNNEIQSQKNKLESLLDNFLSESTSETMKKIIQNKIEDIEKNIKELEEEVLSSQRLIIDKDKEKNIINSKIKELKREINEKHKNELTRNEWIDKVEAVKIFDKSSFEVVWKM